MYFQAAVAKQIRKPAKAALTQADLIAEALETEEINRASLLAFYAAEEDRRAADRAAGMRYEIIGPKLTFLSRLEGVVDESDDKENGGPAEGDQSCVKVSARRRDKGKDKMESGRRRLIEVVGESGKAGWKAAEAEGRAAAKAAAEADGVPVPEKIAEQEERAAQEEDEASAEQDSVERRKAKPRTVSKDGYARNYLIFGSYDDVTQADEMTALFGDHADWSRAVEPPSDGECP